MRYVVILALTFPLGVVIVFQAKSADRPRHAEVHVACQYALLEQAFVCQGIHAV